LLIADLGELVVFNADAGPIPHTGPGNNFLTVTCMESFAIRVVDSVSTA